MSFTSPMQVESEFESRYVPLSGGGSGCVHSNWKSDFEKAGLQTWDDFFSALGQPLSKPGLGKRYRAQLEFRQGNQTTLVFLKRYEGETRRHLFQRWLEDGERSAVALREVCVANALEKIGIATFTPLAWGWQGDWGANQKSFLVMSQVPGNSVERWLVNTDLNWRKKIRLVEQLADFAKRLHESGWFHRDFYLCHIFINESNGAHQLALVDLARMFRPHWRITRWQIKDLAQLNFSAPTQYFSRTMRLRFAKHYFGWRRLNGTNKSLLRKIIAKTEAISRRDRSKKQ